MDWIWVLIPLTAIMIPIVAILAGTGVLSEFAKALSRRNDEGGSQKVLDLEARVLDLEAKLSAKASLDKRLANLETIVTSQTWDVLHSQTLSKADKRLLLSDQDSEFATVSSGLDDARRSELLAQKVNGTKS